jgi:uncharacterized membrane protein YkvA (DUF1232 family)
MASMPPESLTDWLLVAGGAVALYAAAILVLVAAGRRSDARALAGFIPDCLVLLRRLLGDPRVPRRRKVVLGLLVAYLAMPIDLVPDFIPVAGQLDDLLVAALALRYALRGATAGLLREHWPGPASSLELVLRAVGRAQPRGGRHLGSL